jgi:transposase
MRGRPKKYSERQRFMISVLILHGLTHSEVATVMAHYGVPMSRKAVWAQIAQTGFSKDKPAQVRQRLLDRLKANRLDYSHGQKGLPDQFFTVKS